MYNELKEINERPEVWSEYSAQELWCDPHISKKMLELHLDPNLDVASHNKVFIDEACAWMVKRFNLTSTSKIIDFGCGPGLYTSRLARQTGAQITGLDFSVSSLSYAREMAEKEKLSIDYTEDNYLTYKTDEKFDLILLVMCDYSALSPKQRAELLAKFKDMLSEDGHILLDVYTIPFFDTRNEFAVYERSLMKGFWSAEDYWGFVTSLKYGREKVILDKYTIVEEERSRTIFNWLQCFSLHMLEDEVTAAGLRLVQHHSTIKGDAYNPKAPQIAIEIKRA